MPLVIKARVQHAYGHLKKDDHDTENDGPHPKRKTKINPYGSEIVERKKVPKEFVGNMRSGMAYI